MKLRLPSAPAWWRLRVLKSCPGCAGAAVHYHCRVCYGWAAQAANKGKTPPATLLQNWRERHIAAKKSLSV